MRQARVVPEKHGMVALMIALKEAEIKAEDIPGHMHQGQTVTQYMEYMGETPTVMVHSVKPNETTTQFIPTEEEWRQGTSEYHDLGYIKNILSGP